MARDPDNPVDPDGRPYRVYRADGDDSPRPSERSGSPPPRDVPGLSPRSPRGGDTRPYTTYRSAGRGLLSRLRDRDDVEISLAEQARSTSRSGGSDRSGRTRGPRGSRKLRRGGRSRLPGIAGFFLNPWTWKKAIGTFFSLIAFWLLLSLVLFILNAGSSVGIPQNALNALSPGGNMLFSTDTVLILGTDQRPRTGPGSKEPGSNYSDSGSRSDTIMLWRVGGGVSRRLSIPRDTATEVPGDGYDKINAAYAIGGPALAIKTIENFTGIKINHVIIVNLAAFPQFIDDVGGVTLKTDHVCSSISGGAAQGGFTLNLKAGVHHLDGEQALILARTRENACNPAENDLTREARQQAILNAVKSQLFSFHTFLHLPWVASDAPSVVRTDMGGLQLLSMFAAAELGGSAPVHVLKPTGSLTLPNGGDALTVTPSAVQRAVHTFMDG